MWLHPTCLRLCTLTSPVYAPRSWGAIFCAPTDTGTSLKILTRALIDGELGNTSKFTSPACTRFERRAISRICCAHRTVCSWSKYIFKLVAITIGGFTDIGDAKSEGKGALSARFGFHRRSRPQLFQLRRRIRQTGISAIPWRVAWLIPAR